MAGFYNHLANFYGFPAGIWGRPLRFMTARLKFMSPWLADAIGGMSSTSPHLKFPVPRQTNRISRQKFFSTRLEVLTKPD